MWSYYGRKSRVVGYYHPPYYDTIIEPFAGTAVYSLHKNNWKKDVILCDKYEVIINIWKYLQQATKQDILNLPDFEYGEKPEDCKQLSQVEKDLIGFNINRGQAVPARTANNYNSWTKQKKKIASNLHKIRHWTLIHGDYRNLDNQKATWFIDPPYQDKGYKYKHSSIDYNHLGQWCKSRKGQIIVCENLKAEWLDFKPITSMRGINKNSVEAVYYDGPNKQLELLG